MCARLYVVSNFVRPFDFCSMVKHCIAESNMLRPNDVRILMKICSARISFLRFNNVCNMVKAYGCLHLPASVWYLHCWTLCIHDTFNIQWENTFQFAYGLLITINFEIDAHAPPQYRQCTTEERIRWLPRNPWNIDMLEKRQSGQY